MSAFYCTNCRRSGHCHEICTSPGGSTACVPTGPAADRRGGRAGHRGDRGGHGIGQDDSQAIYGATGMFATLAAAQQQLWQWQQVIFGYGQQQRLPYPENDGQYQQAPVDYGHQQQLSFVGYSMMQLLPHPFTNSAQNTCPTVVAVALSEGSSAASDDPTAAVLNGRTDGDKKEKTDAPKAADKRKRQKEKHKKKKQSRQLTSTADTSQQQAPQVQLPLPKLLTTVAPVMTISGVGGN